MEDNSLFAVKDLAGVPITLGCTVLLAKGNDLKFADVDEIAATMSRSNPSQTSVRLRLGGRRSDPRWISSPLTLTDTSKCLVFQAPVAAPATAHQSVSSMLIGTGI